MTQARAHTASGSRFNSQERLAPAVLLFPPPQPGCRRLLAQAVRSRALGSFQQQRTALGLPRHHRDVKKITQRLLSTL